MKKRYMMSCLVDVDEHIGSAIRVELAAMLAEYDPQDIKVKEVATIQPPCFMFLDRRDCQSFPDKCKSCGHDDLTM